MTSESAMLLHNCQTVSLVKFPSFLWSFRETIVHKVLEGGLFKPFRVARRFR